MTTDQPSTSPVLSPREIAAGAGAMTLIDADLTRVWWERVEMSGVLPMLAGWRLADRLASGKRAGGPKPQISDAVILTIALLLVIEGSTVRVRDMGRVLGERLTPGAREVLGITHLYDGTDRNWYFIALRAVHRLIATFDGWDRKRHEAMMFDERVAFQESLDEEHVATMRSRGVRFTNALIEMTIQLQAPGLRRTRLALSVDQTSVRAPSQLRRWTRNSKGEEQRKWNKFTEQEILRPVLELEADLYPKAKGQKNRDPLADKSFVDLQWELSFMGNIIIDVAEDPNADRTLAPPQLIRAASLGTPNKRIAEDTLELLDSILDRGYDISRLTFDRGYSQLTLEKFHRPLRQRGIDVVKDYVKRQKGITNGSGGATFADDRFLCPGTPTELLDASEDFHDHKIDEPTYWHRIDQRSKLELHVKERAKDGSSMKLRCPALGPSPTATCPLREMSEKASPDKDRARIYKRDLPPRAADYAVCCQTSITIPIEVSEQERQKLRYGSKEWSTTYRTDRNSMESTNKLLKAQLQLDHSANRLMRGMAAQQFAFALICVAANMKRIVEYEHAIAKHEAKLRRARTTPAKVTTTPKPTKNVRKRDRLGLSRYHFNPAPLKEMPWPPPAKK